MENEKLKQDIIDANDAYRNGESIMSDFDYDNLVDAAKEGGFYPYEGVEPEKVYKNHVTHSKPMLSMQKAKEDKEISNWLDKVNSSALELGMDPKKVWICTNAKLDGIACVEEGGVYATRGNGIEGNNITSIIDKGVYLDVAIGLHNDNRVLGELVVNIDYFNKHLSSEFSNARNFTSGAIMADTLNPSTKKAFNDNAVVFMSYSGLDNFTSNIEATRKDFREYEKAIWDDCDFLIDGIILMVVDKELQDHMGSTSHHPNYAIALKPKDKVYTTTIKDIEWATGRTGKVTPTAILEPIKIDGVNVGRATAHNAKNVQDMGLAKGVKVEIIRSGSVIPYIVGVIE